MKHRFALFLVLGTAALLLGACSSVSTKNPSTSVGNVKKPLIIAHRGASGDYPEHTLIAYEKAIEQGADFVEPDLVITKDGVLIARHENELSDTTNVADVFPQKKRTKTIDGKQVTGWFSEDLTLKEIHQLRARQRLPFRNQAFNDKYSIPTFEEVLRLVKNKSKDRSSPIGVYPETKHPSYFRSIGKPLEEPLVALLQKYNLDDFYSPVFIQSFEIRNLKRLNKMIDVRLVQLIGNPLDQPFDEAKRKRATTYGNMISLKGLKKIKEYADGIGPWKGLVFPTPELSQPLSPYLIHQAHQLGLFVHLYTFRNEQQYLSEQFQSDPFLEYKYAFQSGVDGVFSDFPETAAKAKQKYLHEPREQPVMNY